MKFKNIYNETKENVELSLLSLWAPGNHRMRPVLIDLFKREPLMAEPVFQSLFPWKGTTDRNWASYLDPNVISKLKIGAAAGGNDPYQHQTESWKELKKGNSIVVTSGTGSGKTECFMYPVLSDIYSRSIASNGNDPVEAIFLYPLNALMEDQKERLGKDCQELGLKFAVYNGSLKESKPNSITHFPNAEVMTRERVRENIAGETSCPQILLTNPSMLEFMLVRDKDNGIFQRSKGKLKWIVIDEAHTYTGSAAIELAYLIKRVLEAFDVTRDDVQFVCTSATIGDPAKPKELTDFIDSLIGTSTSKILKPISGERVVAPLTLSSIQSALVTSGITITNSSNVESLRTQLKKVDLLPLASIWQTLTGKTFSYSDTERALDLLDSLCEIKIGNDFLLMARGHFFMRNIEGLYACVIEHRSSTWDFSNLGFTHITTYKGNGKCPHCGAPLLELVQCGDCKEFLLAVEENNQHQIRPTYNENWKEVYDFEEDGISAIDDIDDEAEEENETAPNQTQLGTPTLVPISNNWERKYLAFYGNGRTYSKPNYMKEYFGGFKWDGSVLEYSDSISPAPWVMLQNDNNGKLYCPTCAKYGGDEGRWFKRFHTPSDWLNSVIAPALLKEVAEINCEWGKYIAFTDSRQGTANYAKGFNADAERAYARANLVNNLSIPIVNSRAKTLYDTLIASGMQEATVKSTVIAAFGPNSWIPSYPEYSLQETADCICSQDMFNHIDYERAYHNHSHHAAATNITAYKTALLRSIIGRRPLHLANAENLGLITIVYPAIDSITLIPNICASAGISLDDWKSFLKICLDYYVRMGNHLQCTSFYGIEKVYLRDSDSPTPFDPQKWPHVIKNKNGDIRLHQNRIVTLLCAGLGIDDTTKLKSREAEIDNILNEAFLFLKKNVLKEVLNTDDYYREHPERLGFFYLDMSLPSTSCKVKNISEAWICPVSQFYLDTIFRGFSPNISGILCPNNIKRFHVLTPKMRLPILGTPNFAADVVSMKNTNLWNDRHKYSYGKTTTGYLTAEHSGQQDRALLGHYTEEFKANPHKLNLLQCSTTMEMGVDIGNIELVVMTNIPPSNANYMQRAGRAGRRGQSRAIAFSLCPYNALSMQVFANPIKRLSLPNPAITPKDSEIIIQRHANSFFIRQFLTDPANFGVVHFNTVESWLEAGNTYMSFINWLKVHKADKAIASSFAQIFGARNMSQSAGITISSIQDIAKDYQSIIANINAAITSSTGRSKQNALAIQAANLRNQDLKGYLAENRFLPNADMPTGIVEFNHMDSDTLDTLNKKYAARSIAVNTLADPTLDAIRLKNIQHEIDTIEEEIEQIKRSCISSREIKIALSEYAPEQTVVINEKNYISAGIETRNSLGQTNPMKFLYFCPTCGRFEYSDDSTLSACTNPGCSGVFRSVLYPMSSSPYTMAVEPIRFRTDVNRDANRKEKTERTYYDIKTILTYVDWNSAISGPQCDIVGCDKAKGDIVFFNPGKGDGFNLCLDCGKMEISNIQRSSSSWVHKDITEKDKDCPASTIENNVVISGKFPTSFVSLRFYENSSRKNLVKDDELLYSLGVLLCQALVKTIGISRNDIDFDVRKEGRAYSSIYIYDTCKGGCGYSTRLLDPITLNDVFKEAGIILSGYGCTCEKNIKGACVNCLIEKHSQRYEDKLSKYKLVSWFAGHKMSLVSSSSVSVPLPLLATKMAYDKNVKSIDFCVDASELNTIEWISKNGVMGNIIDESITRGKHITIFVSNVPSIKKGSSLGDLTPFVDFQSKFDHWKPNVDIIAVDSFEVTPGVFSAMIINNTDHYYTDEKNVLPFSEQWGNNCTRLFGDHKVPTFTRMSFPTITEVASLIRPDQYTKSNIISSGRTTLGKYYSEVVAPGLVDNIDDGSIKSVLSGKNIEITFNDTYVNSALASLMLVYLIKELKDIYSFNISDVNFQFQGPKRNCNNAKWNQYTYITFNFPTDKEADQYTKDCFENILGITPNFSLSVPDHYRWLRFKPVGEDKYVEIRPDHSISGGWQSSKMYWDIDLLDETTDIEIKQNENLVYYLLIKK